MTTKQNETPRLIAEREVALSRCSPVNADGVAAVVIDVLIERFEAALKDRDERAAKIAERVAESAGIITRRDATTTIARLIRSKD